MKDREISEEEKKQAREIFAKIGIYEDEYEQKLSSGELPKEFQDKVDLQVKLQQAQFLARIYSDKMAEKVKVTDEDIAKYIAEHPELDTAPKRSKAEEVLNRQKPVKISPHLRTSSPKTRATPTRKQRKEGWALCRHAEGPHGSRV
jgi:hypothetical protein